jgi:Glycosyl hydrolase family 10
MLSFVVFDGDIPASSLSVRHAHLIGPDNVPVPGEIRFENGRVRCDKSNPEAAGLSLQIALDKDALLKLAPAGSGDEDLDEKAFREKVRAERLRRARVSKDQTPAEPDETERPLEPLGVLTLQTCLLPEREEPYLLSLELARHRLMQFLIKLEEWQLFDLPRDHPVMSLFEQARLTFTDALVAQTHGLGDGAPGTAATFGYSPDADRLALRALWLAIEASERQALLHAAADFGPRMSGETHRRAIESQPGGAGDRTEQGRAATIILQDRPGVVLPGRPAIGCSVSPSAFFETAQEVAQSACEFITMPMRWAELEPTEGRYLFQNTDRWIEWAVRKAKVPVVAGPIIDLRAGASPDWLYIWENDYETLRELICEHVKNVVTRYRRTIARWTVVSGLHANNNFHLGFDHMMDLTRVCVMVVRKLHPQAKIQVEITQPWGEYYTHNRRSLPPLLYAEMLTQAGISVDSFGVRLQMGQPEQGQSVRDLMEISAMLDRCAMLDRPIALTAVGVPSGTPEAVGHPELADRKPGFWRHPWTEQVQGDWASAILSIAMSKPFIQSVCWQELYDLPQPVEMPRGGMISVSGHPKRIADRFAEMRVAMDKNVPPQGIADFGVLGTGGLATNTDAIR